MALLNVSKVPLRAYQTTITVSRLSELRSVRLSGFGAMSEADVRGNVGVLRERLSTRKWQGGPLESLHVVEGEQRGGEPLVMAAFKNPEGVLFELFVC